MQAHNRWQALQLLQVPLLRRLRPALSSSFAAAPTPRSLASSGALRRRCVERRRIDVLHPRLWAEQGCMQGDQGCMRRLESGRCCKRRKWIKPSVLLALVVPLARVLSLSLARARALSLSLSVLFSRLLPISFALLPYCYHRRRGRIAAPPPSSPPPSHACLECPARALCHPRFRPSHFRLSRSRHRHLRCWTT